MSVRVTWTHIQNVLPLNLFFIVMLFSSMSALGLLSVPMVTVWKNLGVVLIVLGDWYVHQNEVIFLIIVSLIIIVFGAVFAGYEDLYYSFSGYMWMMLNIVCTAMYSLYVKYVKQKTKLSTTEMAYINGFLSVPICTLAWIGMAFWNHTSIDMQDFRHG